MPADDSSSEFITSLKSGSYNPGPIEDTEDVGPSTAALSTVRGPQNTLALEEFPEGPYGATTNEDKLGKTSPWRPGQVFAPRYRDANPVDSDQPVALEEPEADAPIGTLDGQS